VLRELYLWREERAAAADRPPFKIVGPDVLLAIAEQVPTTIDEVEEALSSYSRQRGQVEIILEAIQRALELSENELPAREQGERTTFSASARRRIDALRAWRDKEAKRARLDPAIVMPSRLIERVAAAGPQTLHELGAVEGIRQWRVSEWGPELLIACT
jgi:ribonuclease D